MRIAGQRRAEGYPQSPRAGGGAAAIVPLTRQRFIDGGTVQPGLNGSVADPFATIAQFMASRTTVSAADSTANYVGWLTPKIGGYVADIAFPSYVSTELRADSFSIPGISSGVVVTGNATWVNAGGVIATKADPNANVSVHNITVSGTFTVTDDADAPTSTILFSGDEAALRSGFIGLFISSTTVNLATVGFYNYSVGNGTTAITAGTAATSADLLINGSFIAGDVTGRNITADSSVFVGDTISVRTLMQFTNCIFTGTNPIISSVDGTAAVFDGPSWMSFAEAGGSRAAGTKALVVGGYAGGSVPSPIPLPTGAGPTDVSLNGTGASLGFTDGGNFYAATTLVANSVVRARTGGGEKFLDRIRIVKFDLSAFTLTVQNNAGVTIAVIPASQRGFVELFYNGVDWAFAAAGSVAA